MFKFLTNLSCIFNLAVIFMLTSSLPVNEPQNVQHNSNDSLNITVTEPDTSLKLDDFIQKLKTKYQKLDTIDFDRTFLNGTVVTFLNQCNINDLSCMTYFDMLLGLAENLPEDSLRSIKPELWKNHVTCNSFCAEFTASIPGHPFSPETSISMKMKDPMLCHTQCLTLSRTTFICDVKPICSITLSGYEQIISHLNGLNLTTLTVASNFTGSSVIPVSRVSNVSVPIGPVTPKKNEIHDVNPAASNVKTNNSMHGVANLLSSDIVPSPKNDHMESTSNKPIKSNNTKPGLNPKPEQSRSNDTSEIKEGKVDKTMNTKIGTEKNGDNLIPSDEITPIVNVPLFDSETTSASPFISNGAFDSRILNPPSEKDDTMSEEYEDEEGQKPELPSREKSGETRLVNNNDMLDIEKPSLKEDAAYEKYTNKEDNKEHPDEFTGDPDSYFFMYFMFIMVLCVMLYVIYHNKSKVLALVLEGRRGSYSGRGIGRRKHTAAYRKLDSNLEEAITSNAGGRAAEIIY